VQILFNESFEMWRIRGSSKTAFLIIVWIMSGLYISEFYDRGWVPHDEGAIAQSAERVLAGQIPHRDFDELYTGGLTYLHALAFKAFGINLLSLRIVLLVCFLAFVPALYALAVRLAPPIAAAAITLLGVVWSVPNYFASVPSWYNLFFATYGTLALTWYVETRQGKWLFAAGLLGGMSLLVKITGVYYIAAAILFLAFREQILNNRAAEEQHAILRLFLSVKSICVFVFLVGLLTILQWRPTLMQVFHFVIPQVAICGVLLWAEWRGGTGSLVTRVKTLCGLLVPFIIGTAIPVILFMVPYVLNAAVADLYRGVFVLPYRRFESAAMGFPPALTAIAGLPYAAMVLFPTSRSSTKSDKVFGVILVSVLIGTLYCASLLPVYSILWQSVRVLGVVAVLAACKILFQSFSQSHLDEKQCQILFLLTCMTGLISLIQFPFAGPIYFCYTAPFVCLTLLAVVAGQSGIAKLWHIAILLFYFLFAITWTNTGYVAAGIGNVGYPATKVLDIPRGGLRVTTYDNRVYTQLVNQIHEHSNSNYIYATPDCPEIYFLSGMRNPTRNLFEFFSDTGRDASSLRALLEEKNINVVIINQKPQFSRIVDHRGLALLQRDYPNVVDIGHFTVRWKE
jgi:Dolichyl-phosphate-mannose-protein mannosyltransferase